MTITLQQAKDLLDKCICVRTGFLDIAQVDTFEIKEEPDNLWLRIRWYNSAAGRMGYNDFLERGNYELEVSEDNVLRVFDDEGFNVFLTLLTPLDISKEVLTYS